LPFMESNPNKIEEVFFKYDTPVGTNYIGFALKTMNDDERGTLEGILNE